MKLIRVMFTSCALIAGAVPLAAAQQGQPEGQAQQRMMMGGNQMPMIGMMGQGGMMMPMMGMMMSQGGMMPMMGMTDHIEGRLAFLKTELKITDAQLPQWNTFADAARASATQMNTMMQQGSAMMQGGTPPGLPQRLELQEKHLAAHLETLRKMKAAMLPLYASLSDEQKRSADALIHGPMGM
jgi:hypothetical protein